MIGRIGAAVATMAAVVVSVTATVGSASGPAASAVVVETTVPLVGGYEPPDGYRVLVDDTERLTVAVPESWDQVETVTFDYFGLALPRIIATTDFDAWNESDSYDVPGTLYAAFPYFDNPHDLYNEIGPPLRCQRVEPVPYDDGAFAGLWWQHRDCGPSGEAEFHVVVASPAGNEFTLLVVVQLVDAQDAPALEVIHESFNITPMATWPETDWIATTTTTSTTSSTTTTTTTTIPTPSIAPTVPGPSTTAAAPGVRQLVDDTNLLTVSVPAAWTDQNTAPGDHDDGSPRPTIVAGVSIADYLGGFDAPGLRVVALPPSIEPALVLANADFTAECTRGGQTLFDNGSFSGQTRTWSECGTADNVDIVHVAGRPPDGSFTLFLELQYDSADTPARDLVIGSIGVVPGTSYSQPEPSAPVATVGAVRPALLDGPIQSGAVTVTDDRNEISVAVPQEWADHDGAPAFNDDLTPRPRVFAATEVDAMFSDWAVPGVIMIEYPAGDAATLLANRAWDVQCGDGGLQTFDNGTYQGYLQTWSDCGVTATRIVSVAVSPADGSALLYLEIQLPTADDTALETILASFRQL